MRRYIITYIIGDEEDFSSLVSHLTENDCLLNSSQGCIGFYSLHHREDTLEAGLYRDRDEGNQWCLRAYEGSKLVTLVDQYIQNNTDS